ncbi:unnamed protein product [Bemisia tabaci]|uniref:Histone-lysine N-methyltransferase eggless n=1 Tax=Bemisia tabaci TaxID=7038 RepID=A0A9P0AN67_BEMTA|nr:unnamed protein product [Bemisia tabaci]
MEVDDSDDIMEIDQNDSVAPSWPAPPVAQPECIDMTSDDEAPVVINIQSKDSASTILKKFCKSNSDPVPEAPTNVEQSISKLNQISVTAVNTIDNQNLTSNGQNSNHNVKAVEADCIELDDDVTICDPSPANLTTTLPSSAGNPKDVADSGEKSEETTNGHQPLVQNHSNQQALNRLVETCVQDSSSSKPNNSNDECEMVILTDDDEKEESNTSVSNAAPASDASVHSNGEEASTNTDPTDKINLTDDKKVRNSVSNDQDADVVVLTDDENTPDSGTPKEAASDDGKSVASKSLVTDEPDQKTSVHEASADETSVEDTISLVKIDLTDDEPSDMKDESTVSTAVPQGEPKISEKLGSTTKDIPLKAEDDEKKPNSCSFDQDINMVILTDDECTPDTKKTPAEVKPDSEESTDGDKPVSNDPQQKTEVSKTVADEKSPKDTVQLVKIDLTDDDPSEKEDEKVTSTVPDKSLISEESKIPEKSETNKQEAPKIDVCDVDLTDEEGPEPKGATGIASIQTPEGTIIGKAINPNLKDDSLFKTPKPPTAVEVIDIEAIREKRLGSYECVNPNCKSGEGLRLAETFVMTYYNVKPKRGLKMCEECYNTAMNYADSLLQKLEKHESIFDVPHNPDSLIVSLDLDSDDESETKAENPELKRRKLFKTSENYLDETIQKVLNKYDFKFQMEEGNKKVASEIERIKAEFDSMKLEIDVHTQNLKDMHNQIHDPYRPRYTPVRELSIIDCHIQPYGCRVPLKTDRNKPLIFQPNVPQQLSPQRGVFQRPQLPAPRQPTTAFPSSHRMAVATKKVTPFNKSNILDTKNFSTLNSDIVQLIPAKIMPPPNLPSQGPLIRTPVKVNEIVYYMKSTLYGVWIPGKVMKVSAVDRKSAQGPFKFLYKIRPEPVKKYSDAYRSVFGKFLAYYHPASVRLPVGTRVIAIFKEENDKGKSDKFYAGVIAEIPKSINKFRYLVFFDDGYAQYINHEDIRVVCESSANVWDDVLPEFKDFIQKYISDYPERPMVKLQKKQMVKTEWNGKWWIARVLEIDASLVKMWFDADRRVEWIYRGSTRLGPLFAAHKRQESGDRLVRGNLRNRNTPYVEYTRQEGEGAVESKDGSYDSPQAYPEVVEKRAVARKSGTGKPSMQRSPDAARKENQMTIPNTRYIPVKVPSKLDLVDTSRAIRPRTFSPHQCGPRCVSWVGYTGDEGKGYGPLVLPLLFGFERVLTKLRNKGIIFYIAPCGRRLRNISEIHRYLRITKSLMTVDQFSFEEWVNCLSEFKITRCFNYIKDLSYGKEKQPISCVNYLDNLMPQYVHYITEREPREGVHLNLDPGFLVCCDCTDDCQNKEKCACWQLTMEGQKVIPGMDDAELNEGYIYRRLPERIVTGIYECNSRCRCSKTTCLNRVVQHPLMQRLQLFKTERKGWGIRCLNDIPIGSFICIYAGHLLTENSANEEGKNYGDEYLAELDYIEVIERIKEDYEESVPEELMSEAEKSAGSSEDSEEERSKSRPTSPRSRKMDAEFELKCASSEQSEFKMMLRKKPDKSKKKSDDKSSSDGEKSSNKEDDGDSDGDGDDRKQNRAPLRFNPTVDEDPGDEKEGKSLRYLFGEDECVYVMDAKCNGNIGRYLNHSCEPNVFVQNVFVDTHDLRFPWVAFFALNYIPAGQELTWDYNYDVNSVPGKVLYCYCNSSECRGRLL